MDQLCEMVMSVKAAGGLLLSFCGFFGRVNHYIPFILFLLFISHLHTFGFLGLPGSLRSFLCEVLGWLSTINVTHERSHIWLQFS